MKFLFETVKAWLRRRVTALRREEGKVKREEGKDTRSVYVNDNENVATAPCQAKNKNRLHGEKA